MLTWNVLIGDFNSGEIVDYNIFSHYSFVQDCAKSAKRCGDNRESFAEAVRADLMYYFWSKCEWEVVIRHWPHHPERDHERKIDVYEQVKMNWDVFMDYLWAHKGELKIDRRKREKRTAESGAGGD